MTKDEFYASEDEKKQLKEKMINKARVVLDYLEKNPRPNIVGEVNLNVIERLEKEGIPTPYDTLHIQETGKVIIKNIENMRQEIYGILDHGLQDTSIGGMGRISISHKLSKEIVGIIVKSIEESIL